MGSLLMGNGVIVPAIVLDKGGSSGETITVLNTNESAVVTNDKVWIKYDVASASYKTVAFGSIDRTAFAGSATSDAASGETFTASVMIPKQATLSINPTPSDASVVLTASDYVQVNNSITVDGGVNVAYALSKAGYVSQSGSKIMRTNEILDITLEERSFDPSALVYGDRIGDGEGVATVVGRYTATDKAYVFAVLDAKYMNKLYWSTGYTDTELPNYTSSSAVLNAKESATYNTDYILNNYTASEYPAFTHCDNALSIDLGGTTYKAKLPNAYELQQIFDNRSDLYSKDPTRSSYTAYDLASWSFNGTSYAWCSNECNSYDAWYLSSNGSWYSNDKDNYEYGVVPVLEIEIS